MDNEQKACEGSYDVVDTVEHAVRRAVREELSTAFEQAMTSKAVEKFWAIGLEVLKKQAANRVGMWAFGRIGAVFNTLFWVFAGLYVAYQVAGWAGVKLMLFKGD